MQTERYIREWLNAMAAGGYVTYSTDTQTYKLEAACIVLGVGDMQSWTWAST